MYTVIAEIEKHSHICGRANNVSMGQMGHYTDPLGLLRPTMIHASNTLSMSLST